MLAIVAISAMVAFVFLDPLMKYVGRSTTVANPVVVETKSGALTYAQLDGLRASRELVDRFLRNITAQTVIAQLEKGLIDPRLREQAMDQLYGFWRQSLMGRSKAGPEAAAIETFVLAKRAEELGMVVSDRAINELLKQITDNSLDSIALEAAIKDLQGGRRRVSVARLFDAIRTEMLASKLSQLFFQSLRDVTPAQRFEYYQSLNRKAKAEIMPLSVTSFVNQVTTEPTNEELRAYYDQYKNRFPDPASSEPGFKEPKRASFQYYKADFAKFKDEFKSKVTDAEIAEYYEQNKAQFRAVELPTDKETQKDTDIEPKGDDTSPEKKDDAKRQEEAKTEEDKSADSPATPEEKPPAGDAEKPADSSPPKSEPTEDPESSPKNPPGQPQSALGRGVIRLVSQATTVDEEAPTEPAKPAETPPAAEPASAKTDAEKSQVAPPAKADVPAEGQETPPAVSDRADAKAEEAAKGDEKPAEEIKYEPLEKVADTIRDTIAAQKATARIIEIFDELQAAMRRYADERDLHSSRQEAKSAAAAPPQFRFEELAKAKNIEAKTLDLVTAAEAAKTDIGQVQRRVRQSQFEFRSEPFSEFAFSDSLVTYKPEVGQDEGEGNGYLFWKTAAQKASVPPLDKIRDQVILAWKLFKGRPPAQEPARELARKRAKELADQARAAQKPLKEVFADQADLKVTETTPFTWLTMGSVPLDQFSVQPRMSEVDGVELPDEAFMEAVFKLSPGEIGVAMNQPQDTVYVVRLIEYEPSLDDMRTAFASESPMRYMSVADTDRRKIYRAWLDDLYKDAGVNWLRPPDSVSSRDLAEDGRSPDEADL
jgi:hypothetical protein